jgi:hypothetical protein
VEIAPSDPAAGAGVYAPGTQYYVFDDGLDFDDGTAAETASQDGAIYCERFPARCRFLGAGYDSRDGSDGGGRGDRGGGGGGGDPDG